MTRYLAATQVQERFQISRSTLYRWQVCQTVAFPRPVKIGHRILWREADLTAFDEKLATSGTT
ncbi:helix-turn-helix transcriptional regulator [Sedimentitalea todarodis]|uniref:AlpA family phage regulatory protein n=1 Tax=Sedimentitalea todarodis TaxID=1631240 RepID=A0ABU3V9C3_9RHOB|nr:AlpA family phage regulatory protein [Sedimentitalea todarodis]MDU9002762.1 AlpA family phage regulatory protein [Sedimentitalea todarodis]